MKKKEEVITIDSLKKKVTSYMKKDWNMIEKAYFYALKYHANQYRESGEEYIVHPLTVAYILAGMHADRDTLCAGLLHDLIEDTPVTYESIINDFNEEIAYLVDGVTKFSHLNFSSKDEFLAMNIRRLVVSIREDARIVIIKLVDRLHNMRTIEYKNKDRIKDISLQTLEIYVPLAYYIGAYKIKCELEELCFKALKPNDYNEMAKKVIGIYNDNKAMLNSMMQNVKKKLNGEAIKCTVSTHSKDLYSVYKKVMTKAMPIEDIHDLLTIEIIVKSTRDCYLTLMNVHEMYAPLNYKFKDYIVKPKTNMYRALHTTVFGPGDRLVQFQIRTKEMERIASYGLTSFWFKNRHLAKEEMQKALEQDFPFFKSIGELDSSIVDNIEFVRLLKRELFSRNVYVRTTSGEVLELPLDSTPIDFAYKIHSDIGNTMIAAVVNEKMVPIEYKLQNNDRVRIICDKNVDVDRALWLKVAITTHAKKKITEYLKNNEKK